MNRTEITRDDIMAQPRISGFMLEATDPHRFYDILTCEQDENGMRSGYARSERTGMLVRYQQTGQRYISGWALRTRFQFAEDSGDMAGTLIFDGPAYAARISAHMTAVRA